MSHIEKNSVNQKFNVSSDRLDLSVPTSLSAFIDIPQMADEMWRPQQVSTMSSRLNKFIFERFINCSQVIIRSPKPVTVTDLVVKNTKKRRRGLITPSGASTQVTRAPYRIYGQREWEWYNPPEAWSASNQIKYTQLNRSSPQLLP